MSVNFDRGQIVITTIYKFRKTSGWSPSARSAPCCTHTAQDLKRLAGIRFTRVYKKWGSGLWGGLRGGKAGGNLRGVNSHQQGMNLFHDKNILSN